MKRLHKSNCSAVVPTCTCDLPSESRHAISRLEAGETVSDISAAAPAETDEEVRDSHLDAMVSNAEHPVPLCKDCEVGEPHMCRYARAAAPVDDYHERFTAHVMDGIEATATAPAEGEYVRPRCHLCGPGYLIGDDGCRHTDPNRPAAAPVEAVAHVINQWPDQGFSNCSCGGWAYNGDAEQAIEDFNHHRARAQADAAAPVEAGLAERVWDECVRAVAGVDPSAIHNPYRQEQS